MSHQVQLADSFLVLAEAALTAGGSDSGVPERLSEIATRIAPILTATNLIDHTGDVVEMAVAYVESRNDVKYGVLDDDMAPLNDAVEVGIVAGYLIARMLAQGGAR